MRVLPFLVVIAHLIGAASGAAQSSRADAGTGLRGRVLAPDGKPVTVGEVVLHTPTRRVSSAIEPTGEFRVVPEAPGAHQLSISAPNLAPYRLVVHVPPTRTLTMPALQLWPASYFRVRLTTPEGEPVLSPRFQRQTLDASGDPIIETVSFGIGIKTNMKTDGDGTTTLGPLPIGRTLLAVDAPPLAQVRLPELEVGAEGALFDGGTVAMHPGAVLHVDVVDMVGQPIPQQDVFLEDAVRPSPLAARQGRTTADGRVTFERVSAGRYHLRARLPERCDGGQRLLVTRVVSVPARGTVGTRLVVGGTMILRLSSPLGVLSGVQVFATPDSGVPEDPFGSRPTPSITVRPVSLFARESSCAGRTDAEGRVMFHNFPSGPARVNVGLPNSTYIRRVTVPQNGGEIPLSIPDGIVAVRVTNAVTKQPLGNVALRWSGNGARVEARTVASGDALLESTGAAAGTLEASAEGYARFTGKLAALPAESYAIALVPLPPSDLEVQVVTASGHAVPEAVVGVFPHNPRVPAHVAVTNANGSVSFPESPAGALRLIVNADGYTAAHLDVPANRRERFVVVLSGALQQ